MHRWLEKERPDVVVVFYNDHGLNFFLDKLPTFAIGAAREYRSADEGWNIPTVAPFTGDPTHMPDDGDLVGHDPADRPGRQRRLLVDNPMRLYWKD